MKKQLLAVLIVIVLVLQLVACTTTPESSENPVEENTPAQQPQDQSEVVGKYKRAPKENTIIELVAGGTSGSWYGIFAAISEIVNKETDSNITLKVLPGGGIGNPGTVGLNEADMGLTYGSFALAARKGEEPYTEKYEDVYALSGGFMPMYLEISSLASTNFTDFKEAVIGNKPAKILTGISSTSTGYYFSRVLDYYNTNVDEIKQKGGNAIQSEYGDWIQMASDGHIDLMFNHIGVPSGTLTEITTSRECRLIDMPDDLINHLVDNYAMVEATISAGSYSWQTEDVKTVKSPTIVIVNANVSEDAVYTLLEILDEHTDEIRALHKTLSEFDLSTAWESAGIELHPGAEAFFTDKGYK